MIHRKEKSTCQTMKRWKTVCPPIFWNTIRKKWFGNLLWSMMKKNLYISFVGRKYRISRTTGEITWSVDEFRTEENANYNEAMTIYDVLCNSKKAMWLISWTCFHFFPLYWDSGNPMTNSRQACRCWWIGIFWSICITRRWCLRLGICWREWEKKWSRIREQVDINRYYLEER